MRVNTGYINSTKGTPALAFFKGGEMSSCAEEGNLCRNSISLLVRFRWIQHRLLILFVGPRRTTDWDASTSPWTGWVWTGRSAWAKPSKPTGPCYSSTSASIGYPSVEQASSPSACRQTTCYKASRWVCGLTTGMSKVVGRIAVGGHQLQQNTGDKHLLHVEWLVLQRIKVSLRTDHWHVQSCKSYRCCWTSAVREYWRQAFSSFRVACATENQGESADWPLPCPKLWVA